MADCMSFPKEPMEFIKGYSFVDNEEVYTNGSELVPLFRVEQMLEHYYKQIKDKQEQGLLIELPCKVGDTVYSLTPFCEICEEDLDYGYTCENCSKGNFVSETKFDYEMIPMFGKVVFLTRSEAESALAKMGGK